MADEDTSPEHLASTLACPKDTLDLVNYLFANGADVNVISERGRPYQVLFCWIPV